MIWLPGFHAILVAHLLGRNEILVCAVAAEAERQRVDPYISTSLVEEESQFYEKARGRLGEEGLFQILPAVHGHHRNVQDNIAYGTSVLRRDLQRFPERTEWGLSLYNAGDVHQVGLSYGDRIVDRADRLRREVEEVRQSGEQIQSELYMRLGLNLPPEIYNLIADHVKAKKKWRSIQDFIVYAAVSQIEKNPAGSHHPTKTAPAVADAQKRAARAGSAQAPPYPEGSPTPS